MKPDSVGSADRDRAPDSAATDERCTAEASRDALRLGPWRCDRYADHDPPHVIDGNAGFPLHTWTDDDA